MTAPAHDRSPRRTTAAAARLPCALLAVVLALGSFGCSGAPSRAPSGATTTAAAVASPRGWAARRGWTGHWSGTWRTTDTDVVMSGTAEIDVLERGELRGTLRTVGYEGRLAGQIRPSGRVHGAVYVPDQQLTLMVDGPFEVGTTSGAVATLEVFLRRLDIAQVRVELARRADVARGD